MRMLDTIKFHGEDIEVIRKLSFGEVREAQKTVGTLIGLDEKIKNATDEDLSRIASEGMKSSDAQMQLISDTLINCLGFTQENLNKLDYAEAIVLFNEVFKSSTELKKKLDQPYA